MKKLSQIYANRRNKRMGRKLGIRAPTLKNYFESVYIVFYNALMDAGPTDVLITMYGEEVIALNKDYFILSDTAIADIPYVKEPPLNTILSYSGEYFITSNNDFILNTVF